MRDTHVVLEILINGNWVELIAYPIEDSATEEEIKELMKKIQDVIYDKKNDIIKLWTGKTSVVLRNIDKDFSIFRVRSIMKY